MNDPCAHAIGVGRIRMTITATANASVATPVLIVRRVTVVDPSPYAARVPTPASPQPADAARTARMTLLRIV